MDYTVYWNLDHDNNTIYLALKVKTLGWVGFGIAEITSGSMPGADVIMGSVKEGKGEITDRWSSKLAVPDIDSCQGVTLISAEETSDGYTILEVARNITTTDAQDRSIVSGPNRVIVAFGQTDAVGYHGVNRQTNVITFWGGPLYAPVVDPQSQTMDMRISNYLVPDVKTQYACQTFAMPVDDDYMITQIDPIVNENNTARVHHFVAHVVANFSTYNGLSFVDTYMTPQGCRPLQGNFTGGAVGILSAWAAGGGSQYTPPEAGFPMGQKSTSIKFIILEVHYNNPDYVGGYTDNSGIRIHFTKKLRQYEADVLIIGDPFTSFPVIPANSNEYELEAECKSECTQTFPHDVQVFQSFPHMHQAGRKAWSTQWRNGERVREIGRIEYFAYDHQQVEEVNFTIARGDRLNTHCVFQSYEDPVKFGMESTDEMCMHFLFYYPRIMVPQTYLGNAKVPFNFCGRFYLDGSICGASINYNLTNYNLVHPDPVGRLNTTFGIVPEVCPILLNYSAPTPSPTLSPSTTSAFEENGASSLSSLSLLSLVGLFLVAAFW